MNTDADQLLVKRKKTASITCLVAGVLVLASLFLPWLKAAKRYGDVSMTLLSLKMCVDGECKKLSNFEVAKQLKDEYADYQKMVQSLRESGEDDLPRRTVDEPGTSFAYFGIATLIMAVIGGLALLVAGGMGLKDRFIREPIAITTVALIGLCLALVLGCIFVAVKPGDSESARTLGVSWPFFIFGIGVVGGIAGAQMLGKAYGPPEYDPYADQTVPS